MCNSKTSPPPERVRNYFSVHVHGYLLLLFLFFLFNDGVTCGSVFNHLLDDTPLPVNEVSSSVLVASYSHGSLQNGKGPVAGAKPSSTEVEKGLLTLIASDCPGVQVRSCYFC